MRTNSFLCVLLTIAGAACASSQADEIRDARMERTDERTVAKTQTIEEREAARNKAVKHDHDVAAEAIADGPDENAAAKRVDVTKARDSYQSKAQARIETIDVRIHAAQEKLRTQGVKAPSKMERDLDALAKEEKSVEQEVRTLPDSSTATWETARNKLEDRLTSLNERVKNLTDKIEDL